MSPQPRSRVRARARGAKPVRRAPMRALSAPVPRCRRVSSPTTSSRASWPRAGIETSDEWIVARTGIRQRYHRRAGVTTADLGTRAARAALEMAGVEADSVDLIVVATSTPDQIFPSAACLIQARLGQSRLPAFDVQAVCSGFVYALVVAEAMMHRGTHRRALVIGAEVFSRILDWNDRTHLRAVRRWCRSGRARGARTSPASWPANCAPTAVRPASCARRAGQPGRGRGPSVSDAWTARPSSSWRSRRLARRRSKCCAARAWRPTNSTG